MVFRLAPRPWSCVTLKRLLKSFDSCWVVKKQFDTGCRMGHLTFVKPCSLFDTLQLVWDRSNIWPLQHKMINQSLHLGTFLKAFQVNQYILLSHRDIIYSHPKITDCRPGHRGDTGSLKPNLEKMTQNDIISYSIASWQEYLS